MGGPSAASQETIVSGGIEFAAAWLVCRARIVKPGEALVKIRLADRDQTAPFFVDASLVTSGSDLETGAEVDARVKVILLGEINGHVSVEVPGEPMSFGPRVAVRPDDLVS